MRLSREYSMTSQSEFKKTREQGIAKGGKFLVLSTLEDTSLPHCKIGIIVTKKIGNAVTRNRLKRRVHAILASHIDKIKAPRYIVTVLRWSAPDAASAELEKDWLRLAKRLQIIDSE